MGGDQATVERDEEIFDTGLVYTEGEPVVIAVRRRGWRYDLRDDGRAVELAGKRRGWREAAVVAVGAFNLNLTRTGVVSVPAVEGGADREWLAGRVAEASLAVYDALLELE
jgi:hypothetical protein